MFLFIIQMIEPSFPAMLCWFEDQEIRFKEKWFSYFIPSTSSLLPNWFY